METWKKILSLSVATAVLLGATIAMLVYAFLILAERTPADMLTHNYNTILFLPAWVMWLLPAVAIVAVLLALTAAFHNMKTLVASYILQETSTSQAVNSRHSLPSTFEFRLLLGATSWPPLRSLQALLHCFWHPKSSSQVTRKVISIVSIPYALCILTIASSSILLAKDHATAAILLPYGTPGVHPWGRTLAPPANRTDLYTGTQEAYRTAVNTSNLNCISPAGSLSLPPVMPPGEVFILTDARASKQNVAFLASSYGIATWTGLADCRMNVGDLSFDCPAYGLNGSMEQEFNAADMKWVSVREDPSNVVPYVAYVVDWALPMLLSANDTLISSFTNDSNGVLSDGMSNSSNIAVLGNSTIFTVVHGISTSFTANYTQQGPRVGIQDIESVDQNITTAILSPIFPGMIPNYPGFGLDVLTLLIQSAALTTIDSNDFTNAIASAFSTIALSSAVGIMAPSPALKENIAITVVRILKVGLWILIIALSLYTVFIMGLCFAALRHILSNREAVGQLAVEVGRYRPQSGDLLVRAVRGENGWRYDTDMPMGDGSGDGRDGAGVADDK